MMRFATVSSKGQITLPAASRKVLGIKVRDRVRIELKDGAIMVRPAGNFFELKGFVRKRLPKGEERRLMMAHVAKHVLGNR
jgi:AbrB family looped-hinge helix DNA binding protein